MEQSTLENMEVNSIISSEARPLSDKMDDANEKLDLLGTFLRSNITFETYGIREVVKEKSDLDGANSISGYEEFDLTDAEQFALFGEKYKAEEHFAFAIVLCVFEYIELDDLPKIKSKLIKELPKSKNKTGEEIEIQTDPYMPISSLLKIIKGKRFQTADGISCVGLGERRSIALKNLWTQFPVLRESISRWLMDVSNTFEYRTNFDALQVANAFINLLKNDYGASIRYIFPKLYSNSNKMWLLWKIAFSLKSDANYEEKMLPIVIDWVSSILFILKDEEYTSTLFPQVPMHNKKTEWVLLTNGLSDDIVVDNYTTIRQIRRGEYKRVVEISKLSLLYEHSFDSLSKEPSLAFTIKFKAKVSVNNPIGFYNNVCNVKNHVFADNSMDSNKKVRNIDIKLFFNNDILPIVNKITRKYSVFDFNDIENEITNALNADKIVSDTMGLSYEITGVIVQPNEQAMALLREKDTMTIRQSIKEQAHDIAKSIKGKSFEEAVWDEAAQGIITEIEAVKRIEEYNNQKFQEKIDVLLKLRDEGLITDNEITVQTQNLLLNFMQPKVTALLPENTDDIDELLDE